MTYPLIDIHPHVISIDDAHYPRSPLFGIQSDWSRQRPVTVEGLIAAMDEAGVGKSAIVQASTCYGFDNSYLADSIAKYPGRLTAVGSVDVMQPDAPERIRYWMTHGITGLRLFTGGSTAAFDPTLLDDSRSFPAWELCGAGGLSMCLQTDPAGLERVAGLAKRFPKVRILLDHAGRPDVTDGPPYENASSLFTLATFENIYLKLTPRIFTDSKRGRATPDTLFPRLVEVFGSHRLAWGSNFPATEGPLSAILETAKASLQPLTDDDRAWIFGRTAQTLYPSLGD